MTPGQFIDAALWFPETRETEPFGPGVLVYKVREKVFALLMPESGDQPARVSLKCEPGLALELRAQFPAVVPGYHLNKRHWNTVPVDGGVPDEELAEMLRHSYERVVAGMRRADRDRLTAALGEDLPPVPGAAGS
ncbi:MmcQ/YjbR family DNA-binding protein [Nocardiopsis halophila]|uniref:MmcQ/YjbR family DNA-binding protein n=1 Tax=Nocardiopsis halophila TaxID=141692 RepID=UPI0003485ACB|nr:MmcQ/YjbR family DNA-binding protein [Nocardiopsis halophila]